MKTDFKTFEQLMQFAEENPGALQRVFSTYSLGPIDIAAAGTETPTVEFDQNSYFVWLRSTTSADLAGAAQTESSRVIPLVDVQLQDGGSDRDIFKTALRADDVAGIGQIPFVLPTPYLFVPNSTLNAELNNFSVVNYANFRFNLIGYRVFIYGSQLPVAQ